MKNLLGEEMFSVTMKCMCSDKDHMLVIDYDAKNDEYLVYMQMDHYMPWWKRLWVAIRFIRGKKSQNCHFAETVVNGGHFRVSAGQLIKASE